MHPSGRRAGRPGRCNAAGPARRAQRQACLDQWPKRTGHPASRRISASDRSGPGHNSLISSVPPEPTRLRSTRATMIASSSCPAIGMKSGTRSNGSARYPTRATRSSLRRRGTRGSCASRVTRTMQSGMKVARARASLRRPTRTRPGLYFLGLLWQHSQASASLVGPQLEGPYLVEAMKRQAYRRRRPAAARTDARAA